MAPEEKTPKKRKGEETEPTPAKPFYKELYFIAAIGVLALIPVALSVYFFLIPGSANQSKSRHEPEVAILEVEDPDQVLQGGIYRLEPFVVNLNRNTGILYLTVAIEFYDTYPPDDMPSRTPGMRDFIIEATSQLTAEELIKGGPELLKTSIQEGIIKRVPEDNPVERIFIEQFVVR